MNNARLRPAFNVLGAPYIKIDATIIQNGIINGQPTIPADNDYVIAPSAKKIATYMINQLFGSDIVTQTEGLDIGWLMPTFKEALEKAVYQIESFVYLHICDGKIYLECIKRSDIHDLVQKFDKVISAKIVQDVPSLVDDKVNYVLERYIKLEGGQTYLQFKAYEKTTMNELVPITIDHFNNMTGADYEDQYILPYEVLINIDLGQDFFADSKKLLNEEMKVINVLADEIEKTRTRIATTQHYQSGDIVTSWKPGNTNFKVDSISVGKLQDYFTLLPGDKDHQLFNFLQGDIRVQQYVDTFKFYDYQIIQMAGFSPASFGYEKDAYMNTANVDVSKNSSDMTTEAVKSQIKPQIDHLLMNVIKAQQSLEININELPIDLNWDYGPNEKFDDMKKLAVMNKIQSVTAIPMTYKAKIVMPILNKLIDDDYVGDEENKKAIDDLVKAYNDEMKAISVEYGEI